MGLSTDGHTLLAAILKEQKAGDASIPYQLVNGIGGDKPVDKIFNQFEDILFSESDPENEKEIEKNQRRQVGFKKKNMIKDDQNGTKKKNKNRSSS